MSDTNNQLPPEGYYKAVAVPFKTDTDPVPRYARWRWTNDRSKRRVMANFEVIEGAFSGRRFFWDGYMTKAAGKRTTESLRYMGLKGDDLSGAETQELNQIVSIKIEHNEYEGRVSARIAFVNSPDGGGGVATIKIENALSDAETRKFAAMMRKSVAAVPEAEGKRFTPGVDILEGDSGESNRSENKAADESSEQPEPSWDADPEEPPPAEPDGDEIPF